MGFAFTMTVAATLYALTAPAYADGPVRCGTPARLSQALATPRPRVSFAGPEPVVKQTRDSFAGTFTARESANFALRWKGAGVTEARAELVLDALEDAWQLYFSVLGHDPPTGGSTYRTNVYVAGPSEEPAIEFAGGYATVDDEGYPYIVMSEELMPADVASETIRHVAVHEFYHDVQLSRTAFWGESSIWFWESTAEWASQQAYPTDRSAYLFIGAYALAPHLPLFYQGDPFADEVAGVHQYGTSIFQRFVSDLLGNATTIPRAWETGERTDDPLETLDLVLGAVSLAEAFHDFAARNAVWDYAQRDTLLLAVELYADTYPTHSGVVASVGPLGSEGWVQGPSSTLPGAFAYNLIELRRPANGALKVAVELERNGDLGSAGTMRATLVRWRDDAADYATVNGELMVTLEAEEEVAWLVVSATSAERDAAETFGYRYKVETSAVDPVPGRLDAGLDSQVGGSGGCGCSAPAGGPAPLGVLLLAVLIGLRRRSL